MKILVLNCGSSSLKYQLIEMETETVLCAGLAERIGEPKGQITHKVAPGSDRMTVIIREESFEDHTVTLRRCVSLITGGEHPVASPDAIGAIGHRVVHGGEAFQQPTLVTPEVVAAVKKFCPLAPLHNPAAIMGLEAAAALFPEAPQVAVFDTAFHAGIPDYAYLFPVPYALYEELGVRRYGFHGISHAYVSKKLARVLGKPYVQTSCITVHLGNGCSMAAVKNGACVDTSMGLTPLMGLMMGTRCGDVDPSLHAFLATHKGLDVERIDALLNKQSGLLGVCGMNDMRDVHTAIAKDDKRAELALKMFCYRVKRYISSYLGVLNGCDAVVFTAGIGENDPTVRQLSCDTLGGVGIRMDADRNFGFVHGQIAKISAEDSPVAVYVIPTNEELEIATQTNALVRSQSF